MNEAHPQYLAIHIAKHLLRDGQSFQVNAIPDQFEPDNDRLTTFQFSVRCNNFHPDFALVCGVCQHMTLDRAVQAAKWDYEGANFGEGGNSFPEDYDDRPRGG